LIQFAGVWIHCILYGNNEYLGYILINGEQSVSVTSYEKRTRHEGGITIIIGLMDSFSED
jgi:hypothetical protein